MIEGQVFDISGEPLGGANVSAVVHNSGTITETSTNERGLFALDTAVSPVWVQVNASGYIGRTIAAASETPLRVELTPREGTVSMSFGGDVMFGRRFYESDTDSLHSRFRIRRSNLLTDHKEVLSYIRPLLQQADITSVNLETSLTTTEWRHPNKKYSFISHPVAATALSESGVNYVALGNNHVFDALTPGLEETKQTLDSVGLSYSGAGNSSEQAWKPVYFEREGLTIGMISCTTITGDQYTIDWSADSGQTREHSLSRRADGDRTEARLQFSGDVGAAEASDERLGEYVNDVTQSADITVVQIHGGSEYQRTPTSTIRRLTDTASSAGADMVINHHPHVTGGVEIQNSTLIAWSLGNLVFDQELWQTFPSYLLTVHVTADGVRRVYFDPILLEGYVPKGVVVEPKLSQLRRTAGLSSAEFQNGESKVQYLRDHQRNLQTERREFSGDGKIFSRESGWVLSLTTGANAVELGTDLLPTGDFEDHDVDDDRYEGPLWRFGRHADASGRGIGRDRTGGIRLTREASNSQRAILSPISRIPVDGSVTLTGQYQYGSSDGLELLWQWHDSTSGTALEKLTLDLEETGDTWARFREDFRLPSDAEYVDFYLRLYPPERGESAARFDDLKLIEWSDSEAGRKYDHLRVNGSATIEFAKPIEQDGPGISWTELEA